MPLLNCNQSYIVSTDSINHCYAPIDLISSTGITGIMVDRTSYLPYLNLNTYQHCVIADIL